MKLARSRQWADDHRRLVVLIPTLLLSLGGAWQVARATRHSMYVAPDSASYLGTADNLGHGRGATVPFTFVWDQFSPAAAVRHLGHVPSSHFPPGYPAVLAALAPAAGSPRRAARVVDIACAACNVLLVGVLAAKMTRFRSIVVATIPPAMLLFVSDSNAHRSEQFGWLPIHESIASEPLFSVFVTGAVITAARAMSARGRRSRVWFGATAGLAAAAFATRYVGAAAVIAIASGFVLFDERRSSRTRFRRAAAFVGIAIAPVLAFVSSTAVAGGTGARVLAWHFHGGVLSGALEIMGGSLVPLRWPDAVLAAIALVLGVIAARVAFPTERMHSEGDDDVALLRLALLMAACYVGVLWFARAFLDNGVVIEPRYFVGIRGVATATFVAALYHVGSRYLRPTVVAVFLAIAVVLVIGADWTLQREWRRPVPVASRSALDRALEGVPRDALLFSNSPDDVYLRTRRPSLLLPTRVVYVTGRPNHSFAREVDELASLLQARGGYVFYRTSIADVIDVGELARIVPLNLVATSGDEKLYTVRRSP